MKTPPRIYKVEKPIVEKHSFIDTRYGKAYAENGKVKTYSNRTQAAKKVEELNALGFNVSYSLSWPFIIVPV